MKVLADKDESKIIFLQDEKRIDIEVKGMVLHLSVQEFFLLAENIRKAKTNLLKD